MNIVLNKELKSIRDEEFMENTKLQYSKKAVQRAGEALIKDDIIVVDPEKYKESMKILSNWRSSHVFSLDQATNILRSFCAKADRNSLVVKRLKRTPSIISKLKRFDKMKLRNMQDIAGCRGILSNSKNVYKVKRVLNKKRNFKVTDYIKSPKLDGYRGIHLITKFNDASNGIEYPVEIQLRSKIQHSWATAVEIIDLFTNQSLKSNEGKKEWLDIFKCISNEFSKIEGNNNEDISNTLERSISLLKTLDVHKKFQAFAGSLKVIDDNLKTTKNSYNLLEVDFNKKIIKVTSYPHQKFSDAASAYLDSEKRAAKKNGLIVALVSTTSVTNLKEAYPNYFADSKIFIENLSRVELKYRVNNPSWFYKLLTSTGLAKDN